MKTHSGNFIAPLLSETGVTVTGEDYLRLNPCVAHGGDEIRATQAESHWKDTTRFLDQGSRRDLAVTERNQQ